MAKRREFNQANYEDKFLDVMYYAKLKLDEQGLTYKVTDEVDLKRLLLWVDKHRKHKGQSHFDRDEFLPKILDTAKAEQAANGGTIRFHGETLFSKGFIGRLVEGGKKKYLALSSRQRDHERIPVLVERKPAAVREKIARYKTEGRSLYQITGGNYAGGTAAYATIKNKKGTIFKRPYEIRTGRFIKKDVVGKEL